MTFIMTSSLSNKTNIYANTKAAISLALKQFHDFTNALNEVCNQASVLGRSLQSLNELSNPEIIGGEQLQKEPTRRFKSGAHLMDSLDTFAK